MRRLQQPISDRALRVLKIVIELYIRDGQPISSKAIAEEADLALSPATIRHIMAELEELGYLRAPHTSAGRIPTAQGYRMFVDCLLTMPQVNRKQIYSLQQQLNSDVDAQTLLENVSTLLSGLTRFAGIVTRPRREQQILRHIEFLSIARQRILVIMVVNGREVQNRVINVNRDYSATELQEAGNYLVRTFAGQELARIHQQITEAIQSERQHAVQQLNALAEIADKIFVRENTEDFVMAGEMHLIHIAEEAGMKQLHLIFDAITRKRDVLHLLEQCLSNNGVQVFIGEESGCQSFDACSVVMTPYRQEGKSVGVLGVIGPTRMPYNHVISVVDTTAELLSAVLNEQANSFAD